MLKEAKNLMILLSEEIKYQENILEHKKGLEASLWGLEEQMKFPENASKDDQTSLNEQANKCRLKIMNCNKLVDAHNKKLAIIMQNTQMCDGCK